MAAANDGAFADEPESPAPGAKKKGTGGKFFAIDQRTWADLMQQHGMNSGCAYLVIAQGTASDNKNTAWSTNSIMKYAGLGWKSAKAAIDVLLAKGFIRHGASHTPDRPRYELATFSELEKAQRADPGYDMAILRQVAHGEQPRSKGERAAAERLRNSGWLVRDGSYGDYAVTPLEQDDPKHLIWLPNAIVRGTPNGEEAPVKRLRRAGDVWALWLFVDLYHAQNLRDDGGISRKLMWQTYTRHKAGEQGAYVAWVFAQGQRFVRWNGPFAAHYSRPKPNAEASHPIRETVELLQNLWLFSFVPHIIENDSEEAQPVHSYGIGGASEVAVEMQIAEAADQAARAMCLERQIDLAETHHNCEYFCPVINTLPKAQMVGIARLTYRPHTKRTGAWFAELNSMAPVWIERYCQLAEKAKGVATKYGMMTE